MREREFETWDAAVWFADVLARRTRRRATIHRVPSAVWGHVWRVTPV